jgi:cell division protein FtsQ
MNTKEILKKASFIAMWIAIGGGMLVLLIAAMGKQKRDHCRDYTIRIKGIQKNFFVDDKDIVNMLKSAAVGKIKDQKKSTINLLKIEEQLEKNVWVKDAELYFDNRDVLHVTITEREPVARIFTSSGKSFYIDEDEKRMSLSDKMSAKVPVFTGFPEKILSKRDSSLLHDVETTALFILNNPFWMAQVSQIDITPERNFEMIPVVGNHTVWLGDGENIVQKFHRLFVFYKDVLSQTGFDKYKAIDVQYEGQVVGVKNNAISKTDTSQLRRNVEKLLQEARELQNDSLVAAREIKEQRIIKSDPEMSATEKNITGTDVIDNAENNANPVLVTNPVPMKPILDKKTGGKPKAVMPKG